MIAGISFQNEAVFFTYEDELRKRLNLFWSGFIIYSLAFTISKTTFVNYNICYVFQMIGLLLFIPAGIQLINFKIANQYLQSLLILYLLWTVSIVLRGFLTDRDFLKLMFFDAYDGLFVFFAPLVALFPQSTQFYKKLFDIILILGVSYIVYDLLFVKALFNPDGTDTTSQAIVEYFSKTLSIPCGFILLTYSYHSEKRKVFAFFIIVLTILLAIIRARRALTVIGLSILLFTAIVYLSVNRNKIWNVFLFIVLGASLSMYTYKVFNDNKDGLFSLIVDRGYEDTRTGVELFFYDDMKTKDWIIGKGINGKYYCPGIDSPESLYRNGIETDYLNIILKGGILGLGLMILIAVPAVFSGIFYSKNILSKAAGIWILLWLFNLYPAPVTKFTLNYLLVWISIAVCYSKEIRNIPDEEMKKYFRSA
jgi:hypothetical protein